MARPSSHRVQTEHDWTACGEVCAKWAEMVMTAFPLFRGIQAHRPPDLPAEGDQGFASICSGLSSGRGPVATSRCTAGEELVSRTRRGRSTIRRQASCRVHGVAATLGAQPSKPHDDPHPTLASGLALRNCSMFTRPPSYAHETRAFCRANVQQRGRHLPRLGDTADAAISQATLANRRVMVLVSHRPEHHRAHA
jgi:hypothetical protein